MEYISEFEDLLKLKDFHEKKMKVPFECTCEQILKALKNEYAENIDDRINRWLNVTHVPYFKNSNCIKYYLQAKMLYRDGFYESAIMLCRSVCEMICYELLSSINNPFGDIEQIETPTFRIFVNYIAIPKTIDKDTFENIIIPSITETNEKNLIKSSYELDTRTSKYNFKIENGKNKKNLEKILELLKNSGSTSLNNMGIESHKLMHSIYDKANLYVHAKSSANNPKQDSLECLNMLTHILSDIYGIKNNSLEGVIIKSGYADFPDICKGMNFAIEFGVTVEDAMRINLNIPHPKYYEKLKNMEGKWLGEWKGLNAENNNGVLNLFFESPDFLNANLKYINNKGIEVEEPLEIKLFGNYFRLIGFDTNDMLHKKEKHVCFDLEFFNDDIVIGENIETKGKVIFKRQEQ